MWYPGFQAPGFQVGLGRFETSAHNKTEHNGTEQNRTPPPLNVKSSPEVRVKYIPSACSAALNSWPEHRLRARWGLGFDSEQDNPVPRPRGLMGDRPGSEHNNTKGGGRELGFPPGELQFGVMEKLRRRTVVMVLGQCGSLTPPNCTLEKGSQRKFYGMSILPQSEIIV